MAVRHSPPDDDGAGSSRRAIPNWKRNPLVIRNSAAAAACVPVRERIKARTGASSWPREWCVCVCVYEYVLVAVWFYFVYET